MCSRVGEPPAILSLPRGPIPTPQPAPPKKPDSAVKLAVCDPGNQRQRFIYDQERRSVSYEGQCLSLPMTTLGNVDQQPLPDPTAFSAVVLSTCPAATEVNTSVDAPKARASGGAFPQKFSQERQQAPQLRAMDVNQANSFTWSPDLGFLRSVYESCNLCIGMCG